MVKKAMRYFVFSIDKDNPLNQVDAIYSEQELKDDTSSFDADDILYEVALTGKKFKQVIDSKLVEIK